MTTFPIDPETRTVSPDGNPLYTFTFSPGMFVVFTELNLEDTYVPIDRLLWALDTRRKRKLLSGNNVLKVYMSHMRRAVEGWGVIRYERGKGYRLSPVARASVASTVE